MTSILRDPRNVVGNFRTSRPGGKIEGGCDLDSPNSVAATSECLPVGGYHSVFWVRQHAKFRHVKSLRLALRWDPYRFHSINNGENDECCPECPHGTKRR